MMKPLEILKCEEQEMVGFLLPFFRSRDIEFCGERWMDAAWSNEANANFRMN